MPDARAEQIIQAVKTLITGLATTGANVQRGQVHRHQESELPALSLRMGADIPAGEHQTGLVDWELGILIESTASVNASYTANESLIDQVLNSIRKEVHIAIMADHTLGLGFVIDIRPGPANEPILSGESKEPTGSQVVEYIVIYRTSRTDISA
ncbi:MAG: hypothetical protein IIB69_11250 [Proteobacteria bacterium]|nr:hypothetical protein [Pseudomonadota bacterium]